MRAAPMQAIGVEFAPIDDPKRRCGVLAKTKNARIGYQVCLSAAILAQVATISLFDLP